MTTLTRRGFIGSLIATAAVARAQKPAIKITDVKCAIIGNNPVVRIVTNQGISGYAQAERTKPIKFQVEYYKPYLIGEDPTDINRIMLRLRRLGAFKPWGAAVSTIEIALWDVAGKAAGLPVYELLGGKIHDRVCAYGNSENNSTIFSPRNAADYADIAHQLKEAKEGYTLVKLPIGFHDSAMMTTAPNAWFGQRWSGRNVPYMDRGPLTAAGLDNILACVEATKNALGPGIDLAFDCGPGWVPKDAIRFARAVEPYKLAWLEDIITGDYEPYPNAQEFKEVKDATSTPIHTGEEIYLRENFKDLIEQQAVDVLGPDPEDVGGIAELKWIAEYANLHGILVAPHGIFDGVFGVAAQVHLGAACPQNYIAFEYAKGDPAWWYDIVDGLPNPIVKNGYIDVDFWNKPGLGITFNIPEAKKRLAPDDAKFFD